MKDMHLEERLDKLLATATKGVRPPEYMIGFYNLVGKIPFKLGVVIFLLTGIDTVRVAWNAVRGRTDAAIQVLYSYRFWRKRLLLGLLWWCLGDHLWQMSYNCRSVRARGIFTRESIKLLLEGMDNSSTVVSLGSGSASQMLQGVADNQVNSKVSLILVDNDFCALETGRKNARRLGIEDLIDFQETTVGKFLKEAEAASIDLIEMVGLADYFSEDKFQLYLREIYRGLIEGGLFLGANISSKEEASYAHGVACWPKMYYRSKKELSVSLEAAGFHKTWTGQCGLYTVWLAQKLFNP